MLVFAQFGAGRIVIGTIGQLARQAQLARGGRRLALDLALLLACEPLVHPLDDISE